MSDAKYGAETRRIAIRQTRFSPSHSVLHQQLTVAGPGALAFGLDVLYPNFLALVAFVIVRVGVSAWRFRKQLN